MTLKACAFLIDAGDSWDADGNGGAGGSGGASGD